MKIIELRQGYYNGVDGDTRDNAVAFFAKTDAEFLAKHPDCKPYHQPSWLEFEAPDNATAPWGHVWYVVGDDGVLRLHSADYDSSG